MIALYLNFIFFYVSNVNFIILNISLCIEDDPNIYIIYM